MKNLKTYKLFEASKKPNLDKLLFDELCKETPNVTKMKTLVEKGAEFNYINHLDGLVNGLHIAAMKNIPIFFEYTDLIKKYIYSRDHNNDTPLNYAAYHGSIGFIEEAVKMNLNMNIKNDNGDTPLIQAVRRHGENGDNNTYQVIQILCNNSDVDIQNNHGYPALSIAAIKDDEHAFKTLLIDGLADPTLIDTSEQNSIQHVFGDCKNALYDKELQEYLLERYPSIISDLYKIKVLHEDIIKEHPEIKSGVDLNLL